MPHHVEQRRKYLKAFDFQNLFIEELGWDHYTQRLEVQVDGHTYTLSAIAEKRGVVALLLPSATGTIPDHATRKKIDAKVTKSLREHLIIFTDAKKIEQVWQWVRREPGKPTASREHRYNVSQSGTALIQKLQGIAFSIEEEEGITLTAVTGRTRQAFDLDRVTKRFYDKFKAEHAGFLKFLKGIPEESLQRWYASVMLNRLMFIYFIQKKRFLNRDDNYLRNKLTETKQAGKDRYYSEFLCPLFFEGFAKKAEDRSAASNRLLGAVPYLNGGLFLKHQIEELHGKTITIADAAFEKLFAFFEQYNWHLDERPLRDDNEINPDVLGYIFEKYINQKQMGAYYTKEDITDYISKNTVLPFLLERAKENCKVAFEPSSALWKLLREDPERYLYEAVRRGVVLNDGSILPEASLPDFVQKGMHDPKARMFDRRYNLGSAEILDEDGNNLALPTETWREYAERRKRCLELRAKLQTGEVHEINDLITYNLNIRQFMQDAIENCEGPDLLRAIWRAILEVSILDPTCGSGAFLFAALNILEPLYEACLDRMEGFLGDLERSGEKHRPEKFTDFRKVLEQIEKHPNERYFILKSIMVNNLYGVDIMEEAIEICKLRLFLKLVAQVDDPAKIEPLPDIDFNIRAGNTLVGYARLEDLRKALDRQNALPGFAEGEIQRIEEKAEDVEALFKLFREAQTSSKDLVGPEDKETLKARLKDLDDELNRYLATEYGIDPRRSRSATKPTLERRAAEAKGAWKIAGGEKNPKPDYPTWLESHRPFHWFVEFYGIMKKGGFDVIIGNPPYLETSKLGGVYSVHGFLTQHCKDIYSWVIERSFALSQSHGCTSMIVPVSLASSGAFQPLRGVLYGFTGNLWMSHYSNRPGQLFAGGQNRLSIFVHHKDANTSVYSSKFHRWDARNGEREFLFGQLSYCPIDTFVDPKNPEFPKVGNQTARIIIKKIYDFKPIAENLVNRSSNSIYWVRVPGYFCQFFLSPPMARPEAGGAERPRGEVLSINVINSKAKDELFCALNSSTYYNYYCCTTDIRHINPSDVRTYPFLKRGCSPPPELKDLARDLWTNMKKNISYWRKSGLLIESVNSCESKPIIDQIDQVLAKHYGFTDEELDFIINYDIKYRMGRGAGDDDDSDDA